MSEIRGQVGIPKSYFFKMAKADYSSWQAALPREFYQNSIDAGAGRIDVRASHSENSITVTDNGSGMDLPTLQNKLLVLGGSQKGQGAVGAFGKAKELLFFSWNRYLIKTRDIICEGEGAQYTLTDNHKPQSGTVCTIWLPENVEADTMLSAFELVAKRMQTKTKIYVDSDLVHCRIYRGTRVLQESFGSVYQTKCRQVPTMEVRIDGIWMFSTWVGEGKGELVMELEKSSMELLTSNRDGFRYPHGQRVERLVANLLTDPGSTLRKKEEIVKRRLEGTGKVRVDRYFAREAVQSTGDDITGSVETLLDSMGQTGRVVAERVKQIVKAGDWKLAEKMLMLAGYQPDFIIRNLRRFDAKVKVFMKTQKAAILSKLWTEVCRQVLIDNGIEKEFTAGFVFEESVKAMKEDADSGVILYLNPWTIEKLTPRHVVLGELRMRAAHEIAHLWVDEHNEIFVSKAHELMAETFKSQSIYVVIGQIKASAEYSA